MVGWDEILAGGVSKQAVIMSWRGPNGGIAGAVLGHDVVMAPYRWMYINGYQGAEAWEPKANGNMLIALTSPVPGSTMYYTLNGDYLTESSQKYNGAFTIGLAPGQEKRVRVITVLSSGRVSAPAEATYARLAAKTAGP